MRNKERLPVKNQAQHITKKQMMPSSLQIFPAVTAMRIKNPGALAGVEIILFL
jgi:hypothetical protein